MPPLTVLNADQTAEILPFMPLREALAHAALEYQAGCIHSPERQVLPLPQGTLLSMPATSADIAIHKLVNVCPENQAQALPTIMGMVCVYDAHTGQPKLLMDAPTVTARRTAAVSMLAIQHLMPTPPEHLALIGCGAQASAHLAALSSLYPGATVEIHGQSNQQAKSFIQNHHHVDLNLILGGEQVTEPVTVVITLTTTQQPIYTQAARTDRLLIGVGAFKPNMAEYSAAPILGSQIYADDPKGARHEAGDLIQAGVDWTQVRSLADAIQEKVNYKNPRFFKSVGSAAWDLAAARCAIQNIS